MSLLLSLFPVAVSADQVVEDDLIVVGNACIGLDCKEDENFGFETLRLKGDDLRIRFEDTDNSAPVAATVWELTANDAGNGGANKFSITDISAASVPFTVEADAPTGALYIRANGDVGFGTTLPLVDAHYVSGNTPVLRLEQDESSGFDAQVWDLAGNEDNFFIRDETNGRTLPFRIEPGAPTNALFIDTTSNIGIGTNTPASSLHIRKTGTTPASLVLEQTNADVRWEIKANQNTGRMTFKDLNGTNGPNGGPTTPFKFDPAAVENLLRIGVAGDDIVDINGNLDVAGNLTIDGQCTETDGACADYVFAPGYELRAIDELRSFIVSNRHLPNVPSANEMMQNGVNLAQLSGRLLEKIEELTLYTIAQEDSISAQRDALKAQEDSINTQRDALKAQHDKIALLTARMNQLETQQ